MIKSALLILTIFLGIDTFAQDAPPPKIFKASFKKGTYYILRKPPELSAKGVMVMLPGLTDAVYSPLLQSPLADSMSRDGYVVMIPILSDDNMHLAVKNDDMQNLALMLSDLLLTQFPNEKAVPVILGGMSIRGTVAIRFYQQYKAKRLRADFNITRVYAIDPPLDLVRLHHSLKQMGEKTMTAIVEEPFAGHESFLQQLKKYSPLYDSAFGGDTFDSAKLRIYCEPDTNWYVAHGMQVSDMNVVDCSAYYRQLKQRPNNQVELILTNNKGYRQPGNVRHPHAWSIVDVQDFLNWVQ